MLIRDKDKCLDTRLILRLRQETDLFRATAEMDNILPVFIFDEDEKVFMNTYFPKSQIIRNLELVTRKFEAVELEDSYVTTTRINNVKDLAIIRKLLDIPSMMLNRSDMSHGFLNLYFRFHSSELAEVSDLLSEYTADKKNSRVDWLGPSPGIVDILDLINSQYPVSVVTYEVEVPSEDEPLHSLLNQDILAEVKVSASEKGHFRAVLYTKGQLKTPLPPGVSNISVIDGVYGFSLSSELLSLVKEASNDAHIVRMRFFAKPHDGKLQVTVFLPSSQVYDYYSILYNVARATKNKVVVRHLLPYSSKVWEFL